MTTRTAGSSSNTSPKASVTSQTQPRPANVGTTAQPKHQPPVAVPVQSQPGAGNHPRSQQLPQPVNRQPQPASVVARPVSYPNQRAETTGRQDGRANIRSSQAAGPAPAGVTRANTSMPGQPAAAQPSVVTVSATRASGSQTSSLTPTTRPRSYAGVSGRNTASGAREQFASIASSVPADEPSIAFEPPPPSYSPQPVPSAQPSSSSMLGGNGRGHGEFSPPVFVFAIHNLHVYTWMNLMAVKLSADRQSMHVTSFVSILRLLQITKSL